MLLLLDSDDITLSHHCLGSEVFIVFTLKCWQAIWNQIFSILIQKQSRILFTQNITVISENQHKLIKCKIMIAKMIVFLKPQNIFIEKLSQRLFHLSSSTPESFSRKT